MTSSNMSNIIPFVSSSPPPIDDDQSFGWDDADDDDFGNFASAPSFAPSIRDDSTSGKDSSSADWSTTGFTSDASGERDSSPEYQGQTIEDESVSSDLKESTGNGNSSSTSQEVEKSDTIAVGAGSDDDFADFSSFQDDVGNKSKPYINSLSLETVHHRSDSDSGVRKMADTVMEKSRESIATDSGLFSTDMSPLPQSESLCISEGDKTMQSDDETFSDMPQDSQSAVISNQVTKQVEFDEDETMEPENSQSSSDNKSDSQSEETALSDQYEQNTIGSEVLESGIETSLNKAGDNSDRLLKENELNSSSDLNSKGIKLSDQQAVSNIQDIADSSSPIDPSPDPELSTENAENPNDSISEKISDVSNEDDTDKDDANWATFETFTPPSLHCQYEKDANGLKEEPEDLVLRKDSINLDEEEGVSRASSEAASAANEKSLENSVESVGGERETECAISELSKDDNDGHTALQENGIMNSSQSNTDVSQSRDLHNEMDDDLGEFSATASKIYSSTITENQQDFAVAQNDDSETVDDDFADFHQAETVSASDSEDRTSGCEENEDFADFSSGAPQTKTEDDSLSTSSSKQVASKQDKKDYGDDFADFSSPSISSDAQQNVTSMFSSKESSPKEDDDNANDFGDFNHTPASSDAQCDHGTFSSKDLVSKEDDDEDFGDFNSPSVSSDTQSDVSPSKQSTSKRDDDDDFGDFNSPSDAQITTTETKTSDVQADTDEFGDFSTKISDVQSDTEEFGDFSTKTAANDEGDDFGDFSGQPTPSSDSGWANFSEAAKPVDSTADDDDFGNFASTDSATPPPQPNKTSSTSIAPVKQSTTAPTLSSTSRDSKEEKLETALKNCFPCQQTANNEAVLDKEADVVSSDRKKLGVLETILQYGLQYQSACTQTWQVVQHPSKKDPRVKLWGHLQDTDGSPAVVYQWSKSNTNSHLFHTLHIDTQNMLIGHKKRSVPIFATGLSLLEPIRGGRNERERGVNTLPTQKPTASILQPSLVEANQPEQQQQPGQDIPAVDFDWSTSGLTNPLTSNSLDLDFLVGHDSHASDKPSDEWDWVFESELLDAPRSNVKSLQPLEDILKSVKPTSVPSRRDDAATSQMSSEALKILSSLPDLTFMQSKVLMFPLKN